MGISSACDHCASRAALVSEWVRGVVERVRLRPSGSGYASAQAVPLVTGFKHPLPANAGRRRSPGRWRLGEREDLPDRTRVTTACRARRCRHYSRATGTSPAYGPCSSIAPLSDLPRSPHAGAGRGEPRHMEGHGVATESLRPTTPRCRDRRLARHDRTRLGHGRGPEIQEEVFASDILVLAGPDPLAATARS